MRARLVIITFDCWHLQALAPRIFSILRLRDIAHPLTRTSFYIYGPLNLCVNCNYREMYVTTIYIKATKQVSSAQVILQNDLLCKITDVRMSSPDSNFNSHCLDWCNFFSRVFWCMLLKETLPQPCLLCGEKWRSDRQIKPFATLSWALE